MIRLLRTAVMASALLLGVVAQATELPWVARSNQNADLLLQLLAKYSPESASQLGVEGFDEAIVDLTRDQYEPQKADLGKAIAEYRLRLATEADAKVRQDLEILISAAQDTLSSSELNRRYFFPFVDVTGLVYSTVQQTLDPRIPVARQQSVVARLQKYAGLAKGYGSAGTR